MTTDQSAPPSLRPELRLNQADGGATAGAVWRLDDPVRQRSFLLAEGDVTLLALWPLGSRDAIRDEWLKINPGRMPAQFADRFEGLLAFLRDHQLLVTPPGADTRRLMQVAENATRKTPGHWLRRSLGWQLPLVQPQAFLTGALPVVRRLWSPPALAVWAALTLLGLYLVSREWDAFLGTFADFSQGGDWLVFGVTLLGLKIVHELGHAFAAVHHGAVVPTMGLSVAYGVPMLYTDTSDVSRLPRRGARISVGAAGMLAEMLVAGPCTLAWALLPDGPLRSTCFVIATTSWITTLAVNLNPLGRFDGYYMLSDALRYPNLQQRSLEHAVWFFERCFLGKGAVRTGDATGWRLAALVIFGVATWLFRLSMGLAAAQIVYHYLFQAAGIFLACLTLWWTIIGPLYLYMRSQWRMRHQFSVRRLAGLATIPGMLAVLLAMPLDRSIDAAATLGWRSEQILIVPEVAIIEQVLVQPGAVVKQGQALLRLRSSELEYKRAQALTQQVLTRERLERIAGDARDRSELLVLEQQRNESRALLGGIVAREKLLELRATADGRVVDLLPNLAPGRWVNSNQPLGRVLTGQAREVVGYIDDAALLRVHAGARARFFAEDISSAPIALQVVAIEAAAAEVVTPEALASVHGGTLPSVIDRHGRAVPKASLHRVRLAVAPTAPAHGVRLQRGHVRIEAQAESLGAQAARRLINILFRELQG